MNPRPGVGKLAAATVALFVCAPSSASAQAVQSARGSADVDAGAWGHFDLNVTVSDSSGLYFGAEGYLNQAQLYLTPSWALGHQLLKGTWAEALTLTGRFVLSAELAGADPLHRGPRYASPSVLGDGDATRPDQFPERSIDGTTRRLALWDLRFDLVHGSLWKVPKADVDVWGGLRIALPTSLPSRTSGLLFSSSIAAGLSRTFGPVTVDLSERVVHYLNATTTGRIRHLEEPVVVNGKAEEPYRPENNGTRNPTWGLVHGLDVAVGISDAFSASASFWLFSDYLPAFSSCSVAGLPTADLCRDGAGRNATWRDYVYTQLSVNWHARSWLDVSLGVSTFQSLRRLDGSLANPFLRVSRDNLSTLWLATSFSGEALWTAFRGGAPP